MSKLEDLTPGTSVRGILPDSLVTVEAVKAYSADSLEVTYKDPSGRVDNVLLYRDDEARIEVAERSGAFAFDGDGAAFRLVSEANRIRLAHLFDPLLAVHTSIVEPLPHQITAVYEHMLPRMPLRFLLADDPGAGKTIMAGLLIKELIVRGDLQRCMIVCPGSLAEQWQDELWTKFRLPFEILTNDKLESARTGNWFAETNLVIARLDKLSRNPELQEKLQAPDASWDLVVCDEAHKMSASFFGGEVKYTKRHQLGRLLSEVTRNLLLMTATPHNGKEEDFQLFLSILDRDRFEGKFREGVHAVDVTDLMRRMVKESLLTFDAKRLFPERIAYSVPYALSPLEHELYERVTEYVREEFNRVERLNNEKRTRTVGFALTILQRRLASSPEAIYQSLRRRRERLEARLAEVDAIQRGPARNQEIRPSFRMLDEDDVEELDEGHEEDLEEAEEAIMDQATAAQTSAELRLEIATLKELEEIAHQVRRSGSDRKWSELAGLLQRIFSPSPATDHVSEENVPYGGGDIAPPVASPKQKLVIFTEHRDTLNYLKAQIEKWVGRADAIVVIHGGMDRASRRAAESSFRNESHVQVLVATDAAGEGINLQRAHLMVNYDLPWNPNRIEQRFGRIHRIGQKEVCHLWNLIASDTREGEVYHTLFSKLEEARRSLGGQVFDVLGKIQFDGKPLRELLIDAIRYGDRPEKRAELEQTVAGVFDRAQLEELLRGHNLANEELFASTVYSIRDEMQRAEAARLQPHFIGSYFLQAFKELGGTLAAREADRFEIRHVPADVRNHARRGGTISPVVSTYERITFERDRIHPEGLTEAEFVCPGHPLLETVIDMTLERNRDLLRRGAVLVDEHDPRTEPRVVFCLDHSITDAVVVNGAKRIVSERVLFVEVDSAGTVRRAGAAPYLDCRPIGADRDPTAAEILARPEAAWIKPGIEDAAIRFAITDVAQEHLLQVKDRRVARIAKTEAAVKERLTKEIIFWDNRSDDLKRQEKAGKVNAKLNSEEARRRADALTARHDARLSELARERMISPMPPHVIGAFVIVPLGLIAEMAGRTIDPHTRDTFLAATRARAAVMEAERTLGHDPRDVELEKRGYDIESRVGGPNGRLRFIEVKGRIAGAATVTVTRNEILYARNNPEDFILAIVELHGDDSRLHYVREPFDRDPDFNAISVNYELSKLLAKSTPPA